MVSLTPEGGWLQGRVLRGRRAECEVLQQQIQEAQAGRSAALVIRGKPGIGKSALLDYAADAATGCQVLRVAGVESQMELAFAGLHQLCGPLQDRMDRLPEPQAEALGTVFGLRLARAPDRFLIGLTMLSLLAEAARRQPVVCLIDDAHWLDQASAQALSFVARRLRAESVVMIVGLRAGHDEQIWSGLPSLALQGLADADAEALLSSVVPRRVDRRVRERILAEAHGNPLALIELPRWFTTTELVLGPQFPRTRSLTGRMEDSFRRQLAPLPRDCRELLLIAAAEPVGDVALLWKAAARHSIGVEAASPALRAGLLELGEVVRFRHPLIRSVVYRSATDAERRAAHQALAETTDPQDDPERHAWHRAHASTGPDEEVAELLERRAEDALAQGGLAAAAAFLERAAILSPDSASRVERQLNAIQTLLHAGSYEAAQTVLSICSHESLSAQQRARLSVLRANLGSATGRGAEAVPLLLQAAKELEPLDVHAALDCYVDAMNAAVFAGRLALGGGVAEVAAATRNAPTPDRPRRGDILLRAVADLHTDGYVAAAPALGEAVALFDAEDLSLEEALRIILLAAVSATHVWDERAWDRLTRRYLTTIRSAGALSALPMALNFRVFVDMFSGDLATASGLVEEIDAGNEAEEAGVTPYGAVALAAFRGHEEDAVPLIRSVLAEATERGEGLAVSLGQWALSLLYNGLGRHGDALQIARRSLDGPPGMVIGPWTLSEVVEAAVRVGDAATARGAADRLDEMAAASGTPWALGVAARAQAQCADATQAESLFKASIEHLSETMMQVEVARARLLYGEWLRRAGRRADAREQLREAHRRLSEIGMDAFAERARRELSATGESIRKRADGTNDELSPQELNIARLAADGLTNPEIGAALFISPRTVEWHMRKVFEKLHVTARRQLRDALDGRLTPGRGDPGAG